MNGVTLRDIKVGNRYLFLAINYYPKDAYEGNYKIIEYLVLGELEVTGTGVDYNTGPRYLTFDWLLPEYKYEGCERLSTYNEDWILRRLI